MYLSAALQDTLICLEMPVFAVMHAYAFSYRDYDQSPSMLAGRMPFLYALRDSFDVGDIVADTIATFKGTEYSYRAFEPNDTTLHHAYAFERRSRAGLRYTEQGKGKYWVPIHSSNSHEAQHENSNIFVSPELNERTPLFQVEVGPQSTPPNCERNKSLSLRFPDLTEEEDYMYELARKLPYGDYRYPCIDLSRAVEE